MVINDVVEPLPPSSSTIAAMSSTGRHMLKIDGYSLTKLLDPGEHIESCKFHAGGHLWCICYYPNGIREDDGRVLLSLELADVDLQPVAAVVRAKFQFSLVAHGAGGDDEPKPAAPLAGECHTVALRSGETIGRWGLNLVRGELEKSKYLKDDSFLVRCEITVMHTVVAQGHDVVERAVCTTCNGHDHQLGTTVKGALGLKEAFAKIFFGCLPM